MPWTQVMNYNIEYTVLCSYVIWMCLFSLRTTQKCIDWCKTMMKMLLNKNNILSEARICLFLLSFLLLLFCSSIVHNLLCLHMSLQIYIITNDTLLILTCGLNTKEISILGSDQQHSREISELQDHQQRHSEQISGKVLRQHYSMRLTC